MCGRSSACQASPEATHASGPAWRWSRIASASHRRSQAADIGVAAADRLEECIAGFDGGPFAVRPTPRPGDLGGVRVRPDTERVKLADPDLGRVVDLTDRGSHDRGRTLRAALGKRQ